MPQEMIQVRQKGMAQCPLASPSIVVIFGATGDLTRRELIASLYALKCKKFLSDKFAIVGFARRDWNDQTFREEMKKIVKKEAECTTAEWDEFSKNLFYVQGNFADEVSGPYSALLEKCQVLQKKLNIPDNILFHLSTPPEFYESIIERLGQSGLAQSNKGWRRVIIEKPFGRDQQSAQALDQKIHDVFKEEQIFRVDHFLGKETVQNMLAFRFANPAYEPIWNRQYIDHVQITVAEELGIGTRGNFYEQTGVIRDMVQNHLLQLLCMTAIDPPVRYDSGSLRAETLKVLESIRLIQPEEDSVLGQYQAGKIQGESVCGYREEKNVDKKSMVPTYVAFKILLDNWRWVGVPFYLRTGKRLQQKLTEVSIYFKEMPHMIFKETLNGECLQNVLRFQLQPNEGIVQTFMAKQPGAELQLQPVNFNFRYNAAFGIEEPPSAYQWLIFDAMRGDQTLFPRADWINRAWEIVNPVIEQWEKNPWQKFPNYEAGSWGPEAADSLLSHDKRKWSCFY